VAARLLGEKNGKNVGKMSNIVAKGVVKANNLHIYTPNSFMFG
jgi:hypothetical protein